MKAKWLASAAPVCAALLYGVGTANAAVCPGPSYCQGFGNDTNGATLVITVTNSGATIGAGPSSQGPYDGSEDTYIGVQNNSTHTITSLNISGPGIFGLDGDGIDTYGAMKVVGNPDTTGYGGPIGFFNIANANSGVLNFFGGLAAGGNTFFSLEEPLTSTSFSVSTVPAPIVGAGWPGIVAAFGGAFAWWRRRRQQST